MLAITVGALVSVKTFATAPGKRMDALSWQPVDQALSHQAMAFDHGDLLSAAVAATRAEVEMLVLPLSLVPAEHILAELQGIGAGLQGRRVNKSSLRRKVDDQHRLKPVEGKVMTGFAQRPAQMVRLKA